MTMPRATLLSSASGAFWLLLGGWLARKGLPVLAETCYRNGASTGGSRAGEAAFQVAQSLLQRDQFREAADACASALQIAPNDARLWCALGAAQRHLADMDGSLASYKKAVTLNPAYAQAWSNIGEWHLARGEHALALENLDHALSIEPRLMQALNNRSAALYELARFEDSERAAREAIGRYPDVAALHVNLANVLLHTGSARQAAAEFQAALKCDPACPEAHIGLATVLGETARLGAALEHIEQEIAIKGESAQRLAALAAAQQAKGDLAAAEKTCRHLLELQPTNISGLITLSGCVSSRGEHAEAIRLNELALQQNPSMASIYSNSAFLATYLPGVSASDVFAYHAEWSRRFEEPVPLQRPEVADRDPARQLRIGYVSGDFCAHPVGFLLLDVMRNHDRENFRIHCYSMMRAPDDMTIALRAAADEWVEALFMSDDELVQRIKDDRIDILIDLSGHTAYNRLPVFVRTPAAIQATWIGYFHSTGLERMDYFITDPYTTQVGGDQIFSETPVFLPHTRFCYSPPPYAPEVAPAPVLAKRQITFGSFNRIEKLVEPVIEAWVRILATVPGSRLVLKAGSLRDESVREQLQCRFERAGLSCDRLELREPSAHPQLLGEYADIDIALDPFPFNGGMTTLEALWMGVPVVTLTGQGVVSRQTTAVLANMGMHDLSFPDVDTYINGAVSLANDLERLVRLREEIRGRLRSSPVCQPAQFAQDLENLYRAMWQAWCRGEKLTPVVLPHAPVTLKQVLHVGCGPTDIRYLPALFQRRWRETRLDIDPGVKPDVIASMTDMSPVESASVDAVYSSHNLEHLHPHEVGTALSEFRRVLKQDGFLLLTCPDLQSVCELVAQDKLEDTAYVSPAGPIAPIDMLYGHRAAMERGNLFMAHKTGFTARSLRDALLSSGFSTVSVERKPGFALWALAYCERPTPERLETEKKECFPE